MIRTTLRLGLSFGLACALLALLALPVGRAVASEVVAYTISQSTQSDLVLLDLRTLAEVNLTHSPQADEWSPLWSPDGTRLAYVLQSQNAEQFMCVYDGRTRCYPAVADVAYGLRWSPDGTQIAYKSVDSSLYLLDLATGQSQRHDVGVRLADWGWSPDGSRFLLTSDEHSPGSRACCTIYLSGGDLSSPHLVYQGGLRMISAPNWSPDGRELLFAATNGLSAPHMYVLDVDSGGARMISRYADENPTWSPVGTQIALVSNRTGARELYLMNPDGSNPHAIAEIGAWRALQYAWSPDGSRILLTADQGSSDQMFIFDLRSKRLEQLPSQDGRKTGLAWRP